MQNSERPLWLRIVSLARPELTTLIWGTLFLALTSVSGLAYPQAIKIIIDTAITTKDLQRLNQVAVILLVVFAIQAIGSALRYYLFTLAGERIVLQLRGRIYGHLLEQEVAFFDVNRTGDLMSRLSSDTTVLQNAVSVNISMALRHVLTAVGGLALMFYTSPKLAVIMLLIVPPVALGGALFGRRIRAAARLAQDALANSSVVAEETLSGLRTVRSFAQEDFERRRYDRTLQTALLAVRLRIVNVARFIGLASTLGFAAIAAVIWMGGRQVIAGELTVGDLTQFLIYLLMVAFAVGALGSLWGDFMSALGAARRVFEILQKSPSVDHEQGRELSDAQGAIEFEQISFAYPTRPDAQVLQDFSLRLNPGEVVALVGPSGAGKSTVSALLSRFYDPSYGKLTFDAVDYVQLKPNWLRRQIGMVSQEPVLISATIAENIRYAKPEASYQEVEQAARSANAHDFISRFPEGYRTLVGERGIQLSGGQKQRVAIARALLKDPKVLILDEATSALDTESEALVQEALQRLMQGRTTLVIAHRLATIQNADWICVMEHGRIQQRGTHVDLLKDTAGIYRKLIEKQLGG
jgi:ABC transporter fused permease/ATP-binding protein